jgi:hypothetical protein
VWADADGSVPPIGVLPPGTPLVLVEQRGAWSRVQTQDGRQGWADGRLLVPRG